MSKGITLDQKLRFIGFRLNVNGVTKKILPEDILTECDIERTLIKAAYAVKNEQDYRLLSVLLTWIKTFGEYVIVEKFEKLSNQAVENLGPNAVLNAICVWGTMQKQSKWKRLIKKAPSNAYPLDQELTDSSEKFPGFRPEWLAYGIKIPEKMLRDRDTDVLTLHELSKQNIQFRNRLLIGAGWRSDIITANQLGFDKISEIEKILGCSYEPAYRISKEYRIATQNL